MNGKPVLSVPAKGIINFKSGFAHKLLCDGPTFSTGSACAYTCSFCYVPDLMSRNPHFKAIQEQSPGAQFENIVIRRDGALEAMRQQLLSRGKPRFDDPEDWRVIYASPLVDVAANMELVKETVEACRLILTLTHWRIRLLSKSNLLPQVAKMLAQSHGGDARDRVIYGVSTGTFDDKMAAAFEAGTALVSKRVQSLHALQDSGHRTFGMVCPSLPQRDYTAFAAEARDQLRVERMEHVWAEVINVRGDSMTNTVTALRDAGFEWEASQLHRVSTDKIAWEAYSRQTFEAHADTLPPEKLRYLQYVNVGNRKYWEDRVERGAVML